MSHIVSETRTRNEQTIKVLESLLRQNDTLANVVKSKQDDIDGLKNQLEIARTYARQRNWSSVWETRFPEDVQARVPPKEEDLTGGYTHIGLSEAWLQEFLTGKASVENGNKYDASKVRVFINGEEIKWVGADRAVPETEGTWLRHLPRKTMGFKADTIILDDPEERAWFDEYNEWDDQEAA